MKNLLFKKVYFTTPMAILGAVGMSFCMNVRADQLSYSNSIWSLASGIVLAVLLYLVVRGSVWKSVEDKLLPSLLFSVLFFTELFAGAQMEQYGAVTLKEMYKYPFVLFTALTFTPLFGWVFVQLNEHKWVKTDASEKGIKWSANKYFLVVFFILAVCYLITLLASYPGFFSYDAELTSHMVFTDKYSSICPKAHVLLMGWILRFVYKMTGSYNLGIFAYLFLQMILLSACFSYMLTFLYRIGLNKILRICSILFMAFFPTVSMFVCCSTKDVIFSGGVVLLSTLLAECAYNSSRFWTSKSKTVLLILALLLICFFRNNGPYAIAVFIVPFLLMNRKNLKKCLIALIIAMVVFVGGEKTMGIAFHFVKGPVAEMFCVPMQQMARVYIEKSDELAKEDKEILFCLIPEVILEEYNPKLADSIKINFMSDNYKDDPSPIVSLYLRWGLKYPMIYLNSFIANTYGFWYPDTVYDGYRGIWIRDRQYEDSNYFQFVTEAPGERHSYIPFLERFYEKISLEIYQQKIPFVSMFFSMGFWHWFYIFGIVYLFMYKKYRQAFAFLPIGLLYLTVLLGPTAIVRYVLYFYFCAPLMFGMIFQREVFEAGAPDKITESNS